MNLNIYKSIETYCFENMANVATCSAVIIILISVLFPETFTAQKPCKEDNDTFGKFI